MKRTVAVLGLWILAPPLLWAGGTEGAVPFNFLFLDANARPVALGGAYAAIAQDANALLYNPAGLGRIEKNHVTFQHAELFQEAKQEYAALALKNGLGLMVNTLSFGNVQRTTLSNPRGSGLDSFGIRDWVFAGGFGTRSEGGLISAGVAGKYLREEIDNVKAQAWAADAGVIIDLQSFKAPVALGAVIQNVGSKAKFQSSQEELPVNIKTGIAVRPMKSSLLVADVNMPKHGKATMHIGAEHEFFGVLALRAGYNGRNDAGSGITVGGGLNQDRFSVDYAFVPFGDLGVSHRLSATIRWGEKLDERRRSVKRDVGSDSRRASSMDTVEQRLAQADRWIETKQYELARDELHRAAKLLPDDDQRRIVYHERMGRIAFSQGDIRTAKAAFIESLRVAMRLGISDKSVGDAYAGIGFCWLEEKNAAEAEGFFKKALEVGPSPARRQMIEGTLAQVQLSKNP